MVRGCPCMCIRHTAQPLSRGGLERARLAQRAHIVDQAGARPGGGRA